MHRRPWQVRPNAWPSGSPLARADATSASAARAQASRSPEIMWAQNTMVRAQLSTRCWRVSTARSTARASVGNARSGAATIRYIPHDTRADGR